jgi:hypothetical protein
LQRLLAVVVLDLLHGPMVQPVVRVVVVLQAARHCMQVQGTLVAVQLPERIRAVAVLEVLG